MSSNMSSGKPSKAENKGMQCNSTTKSGSQCKLTHMEGSTRCPVHQSGTVVAKVVSPPAKVEVQTQARTVASAGSRVVKHVEVSNEARIDSLKARHTLLRTQFDLIADEMQQIDKEIQSLEKTVPVDGRPLKATTSKERCTAKTQEETQCKLAKEFGSNLCPVHNH